MTAARQRRETFVDIPGVAHTGGRTPGFIPFGARVGPVLFSAATMGMLPGTGTVASDPEEQAELAFQHTQTLLQQAGMGLADVGHIFVWYSNHQYREVVNKPWERLFPDKADRPARHAVVTDLPGNLVVQLEVTAVRGGGRRTIVDIPGVAHEGGREPGYIPFGARVGDVLFSGATMGMEPGTRALATDPQRQMELAFQHTATLLEKADMSPADVAHVFVWYRDHRHCELIDAPWAKMFDNPSSRPACHALVRDLPPGLVAQLEIVAVAGGNRQSFEIPGASGAGLFPDGARVGNTFFTGATVGKEPRTNQFPADRRRQANLAFDNAHAVLESAGFSLDDIGHIFVWYRDHTYRDIVNEPWERLFPNQDNRPVRHAIVADMPGDEEAVIQLEIVAAR